MVKEKQARHVALPRDAETDGSAVEDLLGAAEPRSGALCGGATQRVVWKEIRISAKELHQAFKHPTPMIPSRETAASKEPNAAPRHNIVDTHHRIAAVMLVLHRRKKNV